MAFTYLENAPLDEAVSGYLAALAARGMCARAETVPTVDSLGRITAEPLYAHISAPHYHACAMDGIAVQARKTFGATATTPVVLAPEEYVVVDTGDPLPDACDAVVMIEDVVFAEGCEPSALGTCAVTLFAAVAPWANVRQIGEDICAGEMLLTSNVRIEAAAMGAMRRCTCSSGTATATSTRRFSRRLLPRASRWWPSTRSSSPNSVRRPRKTRMASRSPTPSSRRPASAPIGACP